MTVHAVVPVKSLAQAKQRLRGCLTPAQRHDLAATMLHDVLQVLMQALDLGRLGGVLVVTADAEAAAFAARCGATVLAELGADGLNAAVAQGARWLHAQGASGMLVLPSDVPGVTVGELDAVLSAPSAGLPPARPARRSGQAATPHLLEAMHGHGRAMTLVPSRDGDGTNALLLTPATALNPAYGPGSCTRHRLAGHALGLAPRVVELPGLGLDLDHPHDLHAFVARHPTTRSGRFLGAHLQPREGAGDAPATRQRPGAGPALALQLATAPRHIERNRAP